MRPLNRVLVVDDCKADLFLAELVLKAGLPDLRVVKALDGREALAVLHRDGPTTFDLVFLDLSMPGMDGHAFLAEYEHLYGPGWPDVVVLTAAGLRSDIERTEHYPFVVHHQTKPLTPAWMVALEVPLPVT